MITSSLFLVAALAPQGVELAFANVNAGYGRFPDAITLTARWTPDADGFEPLVAESTGRASTAAVWGLDHLGNELYWLNTFPADALYRGADRNRNGVIDARETEEVFRFDAALRGDVDIFIDDIVVGLGGPGSNDLGLWRFNDGNRDGDFEDPGERQHLVQPSSVFIGATEISSDDVRSVAHLPDGDIIWWEDDSDVWMRTTPTGQNSFFLGVPLSSSLNGTPTPPRNPDFGGALPFVSSPLDRVAVNHRTGDVFFATNFSRAAYVFCGNDRNGDGDINDSGEVELFLDGRRSSPSALYIEDIDIHEITGRLYLAHEVDPSNDPVTEFQYAFDFNSDGDAMDAGELVVVGRTAEDPSVTRIGVLPETLFGQGQPFAELAPDRDMTRAGGTLSLWLKDIPVAARNGNVFGFGALSFSGDGTLPLPGGAIIGLTPDVMTQVSLGFLTTGPLTNEAHQLPVLPYPSGLPRGLEFDLVGVGVDTNTASFAFITGTGRVRVE